MSFVENDIRREAEAAKGLLRSIRAIGEGDDAELVADSIEGETRLADALAEAIDQIDECELIEAGCEAKEAEYAGRRAAAARRKDRIRAAMEQAMVALDLPSLRLPTATVSVARRPPQLIVEDESQIPSQFFVAPAPKLDRKALQAALGTEPVTGARLDNGSISLTIRRK